MAALNPETVAMIASTEFRDNKWTLVAIPACDHGTSLLKAFAEIHRNEWKSIMERRVSVPPDQIIGFDNAFWIVFATHCNDCGMCNKFLATKPTTPRAKWLAMRPRTVFRKLPVVKPAEADKPVQTTPP
jgi:hypothetical protein